MREREREREGGGAVSGVSQLRELCHQTIHQLTPPPLVQRSGHRTNSVMRCILLLAKQQ